MMKRRNFRKRSRVDDGEDDSSTKDNNGSDDEQERRLALEEVKFLQKQRERKLGVPAVSSTTSQVAAGGGGSNSSAGGLVRKVNDKGEGDGENDELVLQDTFAQETAVMEEDPNIYRLNNRNYQLVSVSHQLEFVISFAYGAKNDTTRLDIRQYLNTLLFKFLLGMVLPGISLFGLGEESWLLNLPDCQVDPGLPFSFEKAWLRYVEQELAKKRGKNVDVADQVENEVKRAEDELYKIPEHLKVKRRNSEESSTQWTTGIAEIQLPIEYKLKNIEETEAAKKLLQEKRLMGRAKTESSIPSSYSADYFQRGKDYAEKLRKEHPAFLSFQNIHQMQVGPSFTEHPDLYKDKSKDTGNSEPKPQDSTSDVAVKRQAATDQFMLERFRKRDRHRGMRR
ncbi:hypothetical protein MTR67_003975 [Solanum verrucosum]|uniref:Uncharacterized protein n=1 Tax=Solanum verrucosum TaxID=315347 RepID=A0AAF0PWQ0_SOLVR|nr:hypothetical protein MTR67_003975 [Solanum verrucosum]